MLRSKSNQVLLWVLTLCLLAFAAACDDGGSLRDVWGCPKPRAWNDFTRIDWIVFGISAALFIFGKGMASGSQAMIAELQERSASLQLKSKSASEEIAFLKKEAGKKEDLFKNTQTHLASAQKALMDAHGTLTLLHEMDPHLEAKKAAFIATREKQVVQQAQAQESRSQAKQALSEGQAKIQTFLSNLKGERQ